MACPLGWAEIRQFPGSTRFHASYIAPHHASLPTPPSEVSRQCRREGVFIKACWAALARPVERLARAEAPGWALELQGAAGLGLPCTQKKSRAGRR